MKTKIIFIFFLFLSCISKAQIYNPFPDSNGVWKVEHRDNLMHCPPQGYCGTIRYFYDGDTIINSTTYKKVSSFTTGGVIPTQIAIRQDILNKKIFYIESGTTQEYILYDFSLSVGDTLPYNILNPNDTCTVTSIDSVQLANKYIKIFNIYCPSNSVQNLKIAEGIGSNYGLLERFLVFEHYSSLICFSGDEGLIYSDSTQHTNCNDLLFLTENYKDNYTISVYPNPVEYTNSINIRSREKLIAVTIFNELGEKVLNKNYDLNAEKQVINTSDLRIKGIYVLKLENHRNAFLYYKIIVY